MNIEKLFEFLTENKVKLSKTAKKKIEDTFYAVTKNKEATITEQTAKIEAQTTLLEEAKEEIIALRENKIEEVEEKISLFETKLVDKVSRFLDYKMEDLIPEHLVEAQAKVEVLEPLMEGIKTSFVKNGIKVDESGLNLLTKAKGEIISLKEANDKVIADKILIEEGAEKLLTKIFLQEKTDGLTKLQTEKVMKIFENASYEEIKEKFDGIRDIVINEETADRKKKAVKTKVTKPSGRKETITEDNDELENAWGRLVG